MTTSLLPFRQPLTNASLWHVIDARGCKVGLLAGQIARILMGKHKPTYTPAYNTGDYVVVKNAERVVFSGDKWQQKLYRWHTGYPGGLKEVKAKDMFLKHPDSILRKAVSGMLPKNKLRKVRMRKLRVYVGPDHPHEGQVSKGFHFKLRESAANREEETLSVEAIAEMARDPAAYITSLGDAVLTLTPHEGGTVISVQRAADAPSAPSAPSARPAKQNGTARRMRRIERMRSLVLETRAKEAKDKAKRERLY